MLSTPPAKENILNIDDAYLKCRLYIDLNRNFKNSYSSLASFRGHGP